MKVVYTDYSLETWNREQMEDIEDSKIYDFIENYNKNYILYYPIANNLMPELVVDNHIIIDNTGIWVKLF